MGQNADIQMAWGDLGANLKESWGALRILKTTPEWSRMVVSVVNVPVYTPLGVNSLILQPYGVICMFYRAREGTGYESASGCGTPKSRPMIVLGALLTRE